MLTSYLNYNVKTLTEYHTPTFKVFNRGKHKNKLNDVIITLDTETSHNHNEEDYKGWVYQWALCIDDTLLYGRTPVELMEAFKVLLSANDNSYIIYVHNLKYDWQYLKDYLFNYFGDYDKPFLASSSHNVFAITYGRLEFRCSYKLCGKSLDKWCKDLQIENKKLTGAIDYNIIRYQDTELELIDWEYQFSDVISQKECIAKTLQMYNDTLKSIPLTLTGYTRRDVLRSFKGSSKSNANVTTFRENTLSVGAYKMLKRCFVGGYTHANNKLLGQIVTDIKHNDKRSFYPSQLTSKLYPIECPKVWLSIEDTEDYYIDDFLPNNEYEYYLEITFYNLLCDYENIDFPIIPSSKCIITGESCLDNGKVLQADKLNICVCSLDLETILKQYNFEDYQILVVYRSKLGKLPKWIINPINKYYTGKGDGKYTLKEIEKQFGADSKEFIEMREDVQIKKGMLNSIYGCCATDPIRDEYTFTGGEWCIQTKHNLGDEELQEELNKYYTNANHWARYEWGCRTTALARNELLKEVSTIGHHNVVYVDTDSCFYTNVNNMQEKIIQRNIEDEEANIKAGNYVTLSNGKKYTYNSFDSEEDIQRFVTLGSKCYCMEEYNPKSKNYELQVVVAGCRKYYNGISNAEELGKIENFVNGFIFTKTGSSETKYIEDRTHIENINGHLTDLGSSAIIRNTPHMISQCLSEVPIVE